MGALRGSARRARRALPGRYQEGRNLNAKFHWCVRTNKLITSCSATNLMSTRATKRNELPLSTVGTSGITVVRFRFELALEVPPPLLSRVDVARGIGSFQPLVN